MQVAFPVSSLGPLEQLIDYTPLTVTPETTVWDTIALMNKHQPPAPYVLVVEDWQVVGLFSWEDVLRVVESEMNLRNSKITEAMNTSVVKLRYYQVQDINLVLNIFIQFQNLPIVIEDEKKQLVGCISPETITNFLLKDYELKIREAENFRNINHQRIWRNLDSKEKSKIENLETLLYLQQALESSSEGIIITDLTGKVIYINSSLTKILNYTREELNALGGFSFIWKDIAEYQQLLANIKQGKSSHSELEIKSRNDDVFHIHLRTDAVEDVTGKIIAMISTSTNISEEIKAEKALHLKNQAIDASNNGIAIFDMRLPSKPIVYGNAEFERLSGNSISEALGLTNDFIQEINHAINKLNKLNKLSKLSKLDSDIYSKEFTPIIRNYCKDGNEYWYQLNFSPIFNDKNKLTHYICIQTDITKHKLAEISLFLTQEKFKHLLFSSTGVIYTSDFCEDYSITFISDNIFEIIGYQTDEIVSDSNFWLTHIHPDDLSLFCAELPKVFTQKKVIIEYRFLHKNGNYIWIYEQSKLVKDYNNNPLEIVGHRIDITERKQLEEDFKQALEKEKELNELKTRFISMTSHEFRTPLSTILSSSELLENYRNQWEEEKQLKHFNRITTAVKHMTNLLNDVLFFGKAEAEKLDCNPVEMDLVEYSRQLVEDMQINQIKNEIGRLDVQINFITNQTKIIGNFDEKNLGHILNNLLSNAIKYSQPGTAVNFTVSAQKQQVVFEIEDKGIGIPPEDLPLLFESFHRCQNVGNIQGTGLGLSIVKKCLDMLQGKINVTSEVGVGTKFTVTIPLKHCCNDS
ncbi:MAG: PAS domain S-box protein [Rivularia sp. T60_A2020_040]|nr:PAS domain S-box protein [Rivularia sp. T60_A2020_040]